MKVIGILFIISLLMVSCGISENESKSNLGRKIEEKRCTVGLGRVATEKWIKENDKEEILNENDLLYKNNENGLNNQWKELTTPESIALSKIEEAIRKRKAGLISQYEFQKIINDIEVNIKE